MRKPPQSLFVLLIIISHFRERERKNVDVFVTADEEGLLWKPKRVLRQQQQRSCMCSQSWRGVGGGVGPIRFTMPPHNSSGMGGGGPLDRLFTPLYPFVPGHLPRPIMEPGIKHKLPMRTTIIAGDGDHFGKFSKQIHPKYIHTFAFCFWWIPLLESLWI